MRPAGGEDQPVRGFRLQPRYLGLRGRERNVARPPSCCLLRVSRRELTLCEHRSSHPAAVTVIFRSGSQRVYFESDWEGHPAIYCMHVERLVEKTEPNRGESWFNCSPSHKEHASRMTPSPRFCCE